MTRWDTVIGTIAAIGSIIAGLLAMPAGGFAFTGNLAAATTELPGVQEQVKHKQFSEHVSSDTMRKTLETPYGKASFESGPEKFEMSLESALYTVESVRTSGKQVRTFTGPETRLEVKESPGGTLERCETPEGVMKVEKTRGTVDRKFSGTSVSKVKKDCSEARQKLKEGMRKLAMIASDIGIVKRKVVVSSVNATVESVTVENAGPVPVSLENWTVVDVAGNRFTEIGDVQISTGEKLELSEDSTVLNNDGDTVILKDAEGNTVDRFSYE